MVPVTTLVGSKFNAARKMTEPLTRRKSWQSRCERDQTCPKTRKRNNKSDSIERCSKPRWVIKTVHQELGDEEVRRGHKELGGQGGNRTTEGLKPKDLKPS